MASVRRGRPCCIRAAFGTTSTRAGFQRRRRTALHRLKANPKRSPVDLVEGIWREFLDPHAGLEDAPALVAHGLQDGSPGEPACLRPVHTRKPRGPAARPEDRPWWDVPGLLVRAAGGAPASPRTNDVDMRPVEAGSAGAASPGGSGVMEQDRAPLLPAVGAPGPGAQGRARVSRPPPRLGSERDKGPRLALSKRKLELFLAEPEKRKRRKQHVA